MLIEPGGRHAHPDAVEFLDRGFDRVIARRVTRRLLLPHHQIQQLVRDVDHLAHRSAVDVAPHALILECRLVRGALVGAARQLEGRAELAVDLDRDRHAEPAASGGTQHLLAWSAPSG